MNYLAIVSPPTIYQLPSSFCCLVSNSCLGFLLEERESVTDASQDRDFKLLNSTVTERNFLFLRLERGSDKLKTIYHCFVVTLVMALAPSHQAGL